MILASMPITIDAILMLYSICSWYDVITATIGAAVPQKAYIKSLTDEGIIIDLEL